MSRKRFTPEQIITMLREAGGAGLSPWPPSIVMAALTALQEIPYTPLRTVGGEN